MKLKSVGILTVAGIMTSAISANANPLFDIYAGATLGFGGSMNIIDDHHYDHGAQSYGAIIGIDLPLFRIEGEYNHLAGYDTDVNLGMVNAYFKLPSPVLKPYFGAGLGATFESKYEPKNAPHIDMASAVTYQGMAGLTVDLPMTPIKFDIEARALYANNIFKIKDTKADLVHYDIRAKLRYIF